MTQDREQSPLPSPTIRLRTDRTLVRAQTRSKRYVLATVNAPQVPPRADRMPVNVALVLDRSGSMAGSRKFDLAREAVEHSLRMLRPEDRFSLVVYDYDVDVITTSTPATGSAIRAAVDALAHVAPRGATNLAGGWLRGCEQVATHLSNEGVSRVLLLTDGLANQGITDHDILTHHASELRQRGIATSAFGVGDDFDEKLLRDIAHEGGGNFYFLESPAQIPDLLTSEIGEALEVVLRRATVHVALQPGMDAHLLNRYRFTRIQSDNELRIDLGDLVSGQELSVVIELFFPHGEVGQNTSVRVALGAADSLLTHDEQLVEWTYDSHRRNDAQVRDVIVDREVARLYAARARAEATEANRNGNFHAAELVIDGTIRRIRSYANGDAELLTIARELEGQRRQFVSKAMSVRELKEEFFASEMMSMSRTEDGRARRR